MDCRSLPFSQLPHQTKLFLHFLDRPSSIETFYAHPPKLEAVHKVARALEFPKERRAEVAAVLRDQNIAFGAGPAALRNLDKLAGEAVAVVSGQQVGLFSGPAYAIYKALTAVQLANELDRAGVPAVPVFWMATEDHDLDEVRYSTWFQAGELRRFELPVAAEVGRPVGHIPLGPVVREMAREGSGLLANQGREQLGRVLEQSYSAEETYGSAFGKLFARVFAEQGLILLDPLDARLHRVVAPLYRQAIEERDALNEKLLARAKELESAGYGAQVKVKARSTLLFSMCRGIRQAIGASNGKFASGEKSWTREEMLRVVETEPECFSPNALLRPVVQDYLLPTMAFVAGPAEISYLAQTEVIYRHLLGRMPVILPRADFTLLDPKAEKILQHYGLRIEEVWSGSQDLRHRMERASVPKTLGKNLEKGVAQTEAMLTQLRKEIERLDPTLGGAVETAHKKISYQMENLRSKVGKALDLRNGLISGHENYLEALVYPHKTLQSRELCLLPFLAKWGTSALSELQELCGSKHLGSHIILRFP